MVRSLGALWLSMVGVASVLASTSGCNPAQMPERSGAINHTPVVILNLRTMGWCSGVVLNSADSVVTARHCVQQLGREAVHPLELRVGMGMSARAVREWLSVARVVVPDGQFEDMSDLRGSDVAVLRLIDPISVVPAVVAPAPEVGDVVAFVGYGRTPGGLAGELRRVSAVIREVGTDEVTMDAITCDGDSGGAVSTEAGVVAIASWRSAGRCGIGRSRFTLLDAHRDLLEAGGSGRPSGETGSTGVPCWLGSVGAAGCPTGFVCRQMRDGPSCVPHGDTPTDEPCTGDADCSSALCLEGRCRVSCHPSFDVCDHGDRCVDLDGVRACASMAETPAPTCGAWDCPVGHLCSGGTCVLGFAASGVACDPLVGCGVGLECVGSEGEEVCVGPHQPRAEIALPPMGVACVSDAECEPGLCTEGRCSRSCRWDGDCPVPNPCIVDGDGRSVCSPSRVISGCSAVAVGTRSRSLFVAILVGAAVLRRRTVRPTRKARVA